MGRLKNYARTSKVMEIDIRLKDEQFTFNLYDELAINEDTINKEIKDQPSLYAFLSALAVKLRKQMDLKEKEMERAFAKVYNTYKEKINKLTGRPYDKEYAQQIATANPEYNLKRTEYIKAKHDWGIIVGAVKDFEQRYSLIQTLSANLRKEI